LATRFGRPLRYDDTSRGMRTTPLTRESGLSRVSKIGLLVRIAAISGRLLPHDWAGTSAMAQQVSASVGVIPDYRLRSAFPHRATTILTDDRLLPRFTPAHPLHRTARPTYNLRALLITERACRGARLVCRTLRSGALRRASRHSVDRPAVLATVGGLVPAAETRASTAPGWPRRDLCAGVLPVHSPYFFPRRRPFTQWATRWRTPKLVHICQRDVGSRCSPLIGYPSTDRYRITRIPGVRES